MDKNPAVVNQKLWYFDAEKPTNKSHLLEWIIKSRLQAKLLLGILVSQSVFLTTDIHQSRPFL